MHPCFWIIRPPRAADGPLPGRLWRRLAVSASLLLAIYLGSLALITSGQPLP